MRVPGAERQARRQRHWLSFWDTKLGYCISFWDTKLGYCTKSGYCIPLQVNVIRAQSETLEGGQARLGLGFAP